jgi:transposase
MSETRRKYDKQFKLMAVELSKSREDLTVLAKELDVRAELLYRWRREFDKTAESSFPGNGKVVLTDQEAEIARLKKQLREAELERDILKKAVGIFSRSDGKYTGS